MKVGKEVLKCIVLCCKQTVKYVCINQGGKMININTWRIYKKILELKLNFITNISLY